MTHQNHSVTSYYHGVVACYLAWYPDAEHQGHEAQPVQPATSNQCIDEHALKHVLKSLQHLCTIDSKTYAAYSAPTLTMQNPWVECLYL